MFEFDESTNTNQRLIEISCEKIRELYEKYETDLYMSSKIHHYISQQLPSLLENIKVTREKNTQRNIDHNVVQDKFVTNFLGKNRYYYHTTNESYYYYDGSDYKDMNEDDILHHIVCSISEERNPMLMNWKHKTKVSILKKIKDQSILKTIPESYTIQNVLQKLQPYVSSSKCQSKYLLTILGDNILKKGANRIHFICPTIKPFLKRINTFCMEMFNIQCCQTFKFKYHEKHYESIHECRLVPIASITKPALWYEPYSPQDMMNILCVAVHYSNKYTTSDHYLDNMNDVEIQQYAYRLKTQSLAQIVKQFVLEYLVEFGPSLCDVDTQSDRGSDIDSTNQDIWKTAVSYSPQEEYFLQHHLQQASSEPVTRDGANKVLSFTEIQYLWKDFIKIHRYPLSCYQNMYKKILVEDIFPLKYDVELERFYGIGSSQMPFVRKFLKFWEETILEDTSDYAELELDEISQMFRIWLSTSVHSSTKKKDQFILKESQIIDILNYFHPSIEVGDEKYVYHVRNLLWDKDVDIENVLAYLEEHNSVRLSELSSIELESSSLLDNLYEQYCKFYNKKNVDRHSLLVSKSYFIKYISRGRK